MSTRPTTSISTISNELALVGTIQPNQVQSLTQAITAKLPSVALIRTDQQAKKALMNLIAVETVRYLMLFDMEEDKSKILAETFAVDVIDQMDTWNEITVRMMFRTIRQNPFWPLEIQGRQTYPFQVMGNRITIAKLNEMASAYDIYVSEERLKVRQQEQEEKVKAMPLTDEQVMEKYYISMEKGQQEKQKQLTPEQKLQRAIETQQWHKDNEAKAQELRGRVAAGELTEDEALKQYDEYLLRK